MRKLLWSMRKAKMIAERLWNLIFHDKLAAEASGVEILITEFDFTQCLRVHVKLKK